MSILNILAKRSGRNYSAVHYSNRTHHHRNDIGTQEENRCRLLSQCRRGTFSISSTEVMPGVTHNPTSTKMPIPTQMNERASCFQTNVSSNKLNRRNRINMPKLVTRKPPDQIRQQYLSRLGFTNDKSGPFKAVSSQHPQNSSVKALKKFSYVDDLNDSEFSDDDSYADKTGTSPTDVTDLRTSMRKEKRSVSFHENVNVHLIPNKDMYSRRIKDYIWTEFDEIATNAERNSVEFAAENWDWRQACEEENFFTCPESGQKIHPAHVHWLDQIMAKRMLNRNRPHALLQAGQCPGFNQFPCPVRF